MESKRKSHLTWLGHAGFKLTTTDPKDPTLIKTIYIDFFPHDLNKSFPPEYKDSNDADLILVTHGHFDHAVGAIDLCKKSLENKKSTKIVATYEITQWYAHKGVPKETLVRMNKGGSFDAGFCTVSMVHADHSSGCLGDVEYCLEGGDPVGFIVTIDDLRLYHAGDTNIFMDMELINDIYEPNVVLLPIGGHATMDPKLAALSMARFLKSAKIFIPMHYGTFPHLKGTPKEFEEHFKNYAEKYQRKELKTITPDSFKNLELALE